MVLMHALMWDTPEFYKSFQVWSQEALCKAYTALKTSKTDKKSHENVKKVILSFIGKTLLLRNLARQRGFLGPFSPKWLVVDEKWEKNWFQKTFLVL